MPTLRRRRSSRSMDGISEAAACASTRRRTSGLAVAEAEAEAEAGGNSVAAATATRSGGDLAPARGLAAPRALREAPGERSAHALLGEHRVEGARLGRLAGFDQHVELEGLEQGLAHAHDLGAAVDRLLGERDGERVVAGDAGGELERLVEAALGRDDAVHEAQRQRALGGDGVVAA